MKSALRDFTTDGRRLILLTGLAILIGFLGGLVAWVLLRLIGLVTHLAYYGRVGWTLVAPSLHRFGDWSVAVPVLGGIAVGLMARYGTDKIRGHGIPEALLAIIQRDSKMEVKVALFKPLASAIAIGTGGPFGAEGPIITTGGAIGSLVAQGFSLSAGERRTLLVAGASAGMSAVFGSPIAAMLLAVELLLFEWKPRSIIPVVLAAAVADLVRLAIIGTHPLFDAPAPAAFSPLDLAVAAGIGLLAGGLSGLLSQAIYAAESLYHRLPLPRLWWPALGGLIVGIGGLVDPLALGVGYPTIRALDNGQLLFGAALLLLLVKSALWVLSLSSGTSGGVLAPLLMIGAALGALIGSLMPGHLIGALAMVSMAATLGGALQVPFTAAVFAMETTHAWSLFLPVMVATTTATGVSVLWLPRSILTEKVARRGAHIRREYGVHPLESLAVDDTMVPWNQVAGLSVFQQVLAARTNILKGEISSHRAYPLLDVNGSPIGLVRRRRLFDDADPFAPLTALAEDLPIILVQSRVRAAADQMASHHLPALLVVDHEGLPAGWITGDAIEQALCREIEQDTRRERVWHFRRPHA